ncbi:MAG: hypothetical protein WBA10_05425 [Elainellaceae cyanobacterium]
MTSNPAAIQHMLTHDGGKAFSAPCDVMGCIYLLHQREDLYP